jgi:hypothetical protein
MFRSPTTVSRICSRRPRLSSRLPRASKGALRAAELPSLLSIPFRITSFADPLHLTPIESHSYKKTGGGGTLRLLPLNRPLRTCRKCRNPFRFMWLRTLSCTQGGVGYPSSPPHLTARHLPDSVGRRRLPQAALGMRTRTKRRKPFAFMRLRTLAVHNGVWGTPLLCATSTDWSWSSPRQRIGLRLGSRDTDPGHGSRLSHQCRWNKSLAPTSPQLQR